MLVLSDGVDTSDTQIEDVTATIKGADIKVDVSPSARPAREAAPLETIAAAGRGTVLSTQDPEALSEAFASEAQALAKQVLVTVEVPEGVSNEEATLAVTIDAAGETFTDSAFVSVVSAGPAKLRPAAAGRHTCAPVAVSTE